MKFAYMIIALLCAGAVIHGVLTGTDRIEVWRILVVMLLSVIASKVHDK